VSLVARAILASSLIAITSCARKHEDPPPAPIDAAPIASQSQSVAFPAKPPEALLGKRSCRDGFLFDLGGAPADVGGFGALAAVDSSDTPRIALTGTMGTVTEGALPTDELERVTCKIVGNLRSCFQFELKLRPKLRGELALEIDVALNGKVMQTRRTAGITGENLLGCISNAFIYATYPRPKAKTTFTYALQVKMHAQLSPRSVQIVESGMSFGGAGQLPTAIVKRIVRATFPRFRACYELGVDLDPNLKGQVTASFVVDAKGAVGLVKQGPTTMPDPIVTSCVVGVFRTLAFPEPEGGDVEIAVPLAFANVP
jgi:hypothetical protein